MGGLEEVYMDECVVVEGFKGVESGRGPGVAVGGGAGGSAARRRRFGGWSSAPRLAKKGPTCHKAHAREAHGCESGAAGPGKGVGWAARDSRRWACRGKCSGGRRGWPAPATDAQREQEEGGWRVSQPPYHRLGSAQDPIGHRPAGGP